MKALSIIDSHLHLWDTRRHRYAWLDGLPELNRPFLPADFSGSPQGVQITKYVFVECGGGASEVEWVSALATQDSRLKGIVAHAALEKGEGCRPHLEHLLRFPLVKGVRRLLQGESQVDYCLQPDFVAGTRLLGEFGFTLDLCIRHEQLSSVAELARRVPSVHFILDHFGKPAICDQKLEPWARHLKEFAQSPNVSCKLSGLTTEADWKHWKTEDLRPYFDTVLEAFGPGRMLYGGDWPVCLLATSYDRWLHTVLDLTDSMTQSDRERVFTSNAEQTYCL